MMSADNTLDLPNGKGRNKAKGKAAGEPAALEACSVVEGKHAKREGRKKQVRVGHLIDCIGRGGELRFARG
jgi:hypothetical protein